MKITNRNGIFTVLLEFPEIEYNIAAGDVDNIADIQRVKEDYLNHISKLFDEAAYRCLAYTYIEKMGLKVVEQSNNESDK